MKNYKYLAICLLFGGSTSCLAGKGEFYQQNFTPIESFNAPRFLSENRQLSEIPQAPLVQHLPLRPCQVNTNTNLSLYSPEQQAHRVSQVLNRGQQNLEEMGSMFNAASQSSVDQVPLGEGMVYSNSNPQPRYLAPTTNLNHSYRPENFINPPYNIAYPEQPAFQNNPLAVVPSTNIFQNKRELKPFSPQTTLPSSQLYYNTPPIEQLNFTSAQTQGDFRPFFNHTSSNLRVQDIAAIKVTEYPLQQSKFIIIRLSTFLNFNNLMEEKIKYILFPAELQINAFYNSSIIAKNNLAFTGYTPPYITYTIEFNNQKNLLEVLGNRISLNEKFIIDRSQLPLQFTYSLRGASYRGKSYVGKSCDEGAFDLLRKEDLTEYGLGIKSLEALRLSINLFEGNSTTERKYGDFNEIG